MTVLEKIQETLPDFSKNERRIADHLLKYPYDLQRYSSFNIADICNVSRSAVIRFCQKLGFTGFSDFQKQVLQELETEKPVSQPAGSTALDVYQSCIEKLRDHTDPAQLAMLGDLFAHSRRILCYGEDHSRYSAQQMAFRLARNRIDATYTGDSSVLRSYQSILTSGDMLVIFSISGKKSLLESIEIFKARRVRVVLFTMNVNTPLKGHADNIFYLPSAAHSNSSHLLDDAICFMLAIEMIIEAIQKHLN